MSLKHCPNCGEDLTQYMRGGVPNSGPAESAQSARVSEDRSISTGYDSTATWKRIMSIVAKRPTPPSHEELVANVIAGSAPRWASAKGPLKSIVHMAFTDKVAPTGGALAARIVANQPPPTIEEMVTLYGYAEFEGKLVRDRLDHPAGRAYQLLQYWGGEKMHHRWHLAEPIDVLAGRNGEYFMDENMIAFGATWLDNERLDGALAALLTYFSEGIGPITAIAQPAALELFWR